MLLLLKLVSEIVPLSVDVDPDAGEICMPSAKLPVTDESSSRNDVTVAALRVSTLMPLLPGEPVEKLPGVSELVNRLPVMLHVEVPLPIPADSPSCGAPATV